MTEPEQKAAPAKAKKTSQKKRKKPFLRMNRIWMLFVIIVIEGYVVLSSELLAIRQTLPFVGSGTDTVSIIIAAVLMPLAVGYYKGGQFKPGLNKKTGKYKSVRKKLLFNIFIATLILFPAMSYAFLNLFFLGLYEIGIAYRAVLITIYCLVFIVTPVYLLGQTIPLVSNYFSKKRLSEITGRMLFLSTMGSFLGAVFSTLVLMAFIGVHYTAAINFVLLAIIFTMLSRRKLSEKTLLFWAIAITAIAFNSGYVMKAFGVVENNQYNTISVTEDEEGGRHLLMNSSDSSKLTPDGRKHDYIEFAEKVAVEPILEANPPKDILVVGAGAFTFGLEDHNNNYDFIDIDKTLRGIAEEYILRQELSPNKIFKPIEARAYLSKTDKKYDVILLDAYFGDRTIPEYLVTKEFFLQVREHLKEDGIMLANFIISPNFESKFSRHIDNTLRSAFPHVSRFVVNENFDLWNKDPYKVGNIIYMYKNMPADQTNKIYTDDKNTMFLDKPQKR